MIDPNMIRMLAARRTATPPPSTGEEMVAEVRGTVKTAQSMLTELLDDLPIFATHLLMALGVILGGIILHKLGKLIIRGLIRDRKTAADRTNRKASTIRSITTSIYSYILFFVVVGVTLWIFGVDIRSIGTVAGVGGVAIAFGAQTLIKDIISGFFIWSEGTVAVGDVVSINGMDGTVESVSMRTTMLRNYNGNVISIPNGDIRAITNMSRGFKRAIVDIPCPYEENQEWLVSVIREEMDYAWQEVEGIEEEPEVMSILSFGTDAVIVRVSVPCPVGENWRIEREIRTRIKARFDQEGVQMPHYTAPNPNRERK